MQTNHIPRHRVLAAAALASLALAGCGSLHDERYNWCQGQNCAVTPGVMPTPAVASAPAAPTLRRVSLSADTLFVFDRSSAADMLPKGKAELDALARSLREQTLQVQSLTITGHTDRLGDEAYNDALALQRANTVRDYLKAAGVVASMAVRSLGEREPVTRDCQGTDRTPGLIACLQPDRRVVVDIRGQAR
ncbi:OmpA family protein [Variovorax sp. ZT4R33]|uniref:OmpA family protein n=1 Tax=Variovorax sp. ZT4R33 TaxID=3443743 RepID=UPI003F485623